MPRSGCANHTRLTPLAKLTLRAKFRPVVARFDKLTAFMNRNRGVWLRGADHVVTGARLADNQAGATFASETSYLKRSLVVGESGNPRPPGLPPAGTTLR